MDAKLKYKDDIARKVIIYPNVSEDGIGRYVSKIIENTGVSKSSENFGLLSLAGLFKPLPKNFPIVHIPHFIVPIFKSNIIVCTIQDLTPLVLKTELNFFQKYYIALRVYISIYNSDYLIFTSKNTLKDAKKIFKRLPEHSVIPLGVDDVVDENITNGEKLYPYRYFLCVGRRRLHKNIARVLHAFSRSEKLLGIHLVFAGRDDKYDDYYKNISKELNIETRVHFIGSVEEALLAIHYKQAIALLYPSLYEGFGLPILEAMSNACPVITSDTASMPEVSGNAALNVNPYNIQEIQDAMETLVDNHLLRNELIKLGLARVRQLSWAECATKTMEVYRYLLNKHAF